jgi:type II secretory pathway pseudopilin PulG
MRVSERSNQARSSMAGSGVARARRAYTLVEVLVLVTIMGIAGAVVIPSFGSTDALRVQGALRTVVADMTLAQSDAVAMQTSRGLIFMPDDAASAYVIADVSGGTLDEDSPFAERRDLGGSRFGFARIESTTLTNNMLIFDALGGPVDGPDSDNPAPAGAVIISGANQRFRINVEAYTGRVTVQSIAAPTPLPGVDPIPVD